MVGVKSKSVKKGRGTGFTLIELLMVIGIMIVVMAAAVPAFRGLSRGSAMRSAVAQMRSTLSLARQHAITHNTTVRFVIAGPVDKGENEHDYTDYPEHVNKCLKTYAVYDFGRNQSDSQSGREDDRYLSEWVSLPPGIVFDYDMLTVPHGNYTVGSVLAAPPYAQDLLFPNSAVSVNQTRHFHGITFTADGKARAKWGEVDGADQGVIAVVLSEGGVTWPEDGDIDISVSAQQYVVTPNGNSRAIIVYGTAGRIEVVDAL